LYTTVTFRTLGCRLNQAETETLKYLAEKAGWEVTEAAQQADLVVINSCAVTVQAEAKTRGVIAGIHRDFPQASIIVVGCYARREARSLLKMPGVRRVYDNRLKYQLFDDLRTCDGNSQPSVTESTDATEEVFFPTTLNLNPERIRVQLKVQDGCDYFCAYCIVPHLRGNSCSRPWQECVTEINRLVSSGIKEVVLTGVNLGNYQVADGGLEFLHDKIFAETELPRLRLSSVEPDRVSSELIELLRTQPRLCRHLHLPLQSGSDQILTRMRRRYATSDYAHLLETVKEQIAGVCIGADVMVGFPGEEVRDFDESLRFIETIPVDYLHVFRYSPRPGTLAAEQRDDVPACIKQERAERLRQVGQLKRQAFMQKFIGTELSVLFEEQLGGGQWQGLSDNYMKIRVVSKENLFNSLRKVRIMSMEKDGLTGELSGA